MRAVAPGQSGWSGDAREEDKGPRPKSPARAGGLQADAGHYLEGGRKRDIPLRNSLVGQLP